MGIFKAYDIRGEFNKEIDEELMENLGKSVGTKTGVLVSRDTRYTGNALQTAFIKGVLSAGADVVLSPPMHSGMAWRSARIANTNLAYITASHLPIKYAGLKMYHKEGNGFTYRENMEIKNIFEKKLWKSGKGKFSEEDSSEDYMKYVADNFSTTAKISVDFGGGAGAYYGPRIWNSIAKSPHFIFDRPNPYLSDRDPDPTDSSLSRLKEEMPGKDFGIAYDGDGDRVIFMDDKRRIVKPEHLLLLLARGLSSPKIVANIECSSILKDFLPDAKITTVPVGHTYLIEECMKQKADFGVESSGHFIISEHGYFDDGMMVSFAVAERSDRNLSSFVDSLPKYFYQRTNIELAPERMEGIIGDLKEKLGKEYEINAMDGIKVILDNAWALIRTSNTEPVVRLTVEAKSRKRMDELTSQFRELIMK